MFVNWEILSVMLHSFVVFLERLDSLYPIKRVLSHLVNEWSEICVLEFLSQRLMREFFVTPKFSEKDDSSALLFTFLSSGVSIVLPFWWSFRKNGSQFLCSLTCFLFARRRNCYGAIFFGRLNHSKLGIQSLYYLPKIIFVTHNSVGHMKCIYIFALSDLFKNNFLNIIQKKVSGRSHPHSMYVLSIYLPPPLLINFYPDSSFRHSQFLGYFHFYLSLRLNFTKPISKRFLWFLFIA